METVAGIRGSVPLTDGSGSDQFLQWLQGCKKIVFFSSKLPSGTLPSGLKFNFFLNFVLKFYFASIISVIPLWEKGRIQIRRRIRVANTERKLWKKCITVLVGRPKRRTYELLAALATTIGGGSVPGRVSISVPQHWLVAVTVSQPY